MDKLPVQVNHEWWLVTTWWLFTSQLDLRNAIHPFIENSSMTSQTLHPNPMQSLINLINFCSLLSWSFSSKFCYWLNFSILSEQASILKYFRISAVISTNAFLANYWQFNSLLPVPRNAKNQILIYWKPE